MTTNVTLDPFFTERGCVADQPQQLRITRSVKIIRPALTFEPAAADPAPRGTQPRSANVTLDPMIGKCHDFKQTF